MDILNKKKQFIIWLEKTQAQNPLQIHIFLFLSMKNWVPPYDNLHHMYSENCYRRINRVYTRIIASFFKIPKFGGGGLHTFFLKIIRIKNKVGGWNA